MKQSCIDPLFSRYYTGEKTAPVLTIVIGGNHEASNYMSELYVPALRAVCILQVISYRYHGGWLAPNIYFLGHAGCIQLNGIRIAGASGIFKSGDFGLGDSLMTFSNTPALNTHRPLRKIALRSWFHAKHIPHQGIQCSPSVFGL